MSLLTMDLSVIDEIAPDDDFFTDLGSGIWLMDDHKWAFYIWNRYHVQSGIPKFSLVHADYHWDSVNDFHDAPEQTENLLAADDAQLRDMIREEHGFIRFDSFIAPAILRGSIDEVHFYCKQDDWFDSKFNDETLERTGTRQFVHEDVNALAQQAFPSPLILDLCLDLFNKADYWYESDLWSEEEILAFLEAIRPLIEQAVLITVSLSFGYSGTEDDTRRLAKLVLPVLAQWRSNNKPAAGLASVS